VEWRERATERHGEALDVAVEIVDEALQLVPWKKQGADR
jgi:hypothetical protein